MLKGKAEEQRFVFTFERSGGGHRDTRKGES